MVQMFYLTYLSPIPLNQYQLSFFLSALLKVNCYFLKVKVKHLPFQSLNYLIAVKFLIIAVFETLLVYVFFHFPLLITFFIIIVFLPLASSSLKNLLPFVKALIINVINVNKFIFKINNLFINLFCNIFLYQKKKKELEIFQCCSLRFSSKIDLLLSK